MDWTRFQLNYQQSNLIRGRYTYTGAFTASATEPASGDALADFLLGFPQKTERTVGSPLAYLRQSNYGLFMQHDWQVTSRLTINTGLRYEYNAPFSEDTQQAAEPRLFRSYTRARARNAPLRTQGASTSLPRFGLAWRLPSETVFRAAYGIYFNPEIALEAYDLVLNGVQSQVNTTDGSAFSRTHDPKRLRRNLRYRIPKLLRTRSTRSDALHPAVERRLRKGASCRRLV